MSELARVGVFGSMIEDIKWFRSSQRTGALEQPVWQVGRFPGGCGRNIAENLGRIGMAVAFAGLTESNNRGRTFADRLSSAGVTLFLTPVPSGIGSFDCWVDEQGEPHNGDLSLPASQQITWERATQALNWMRGAQLIIVESGICEDMLRRLRAWSSARRISLCGVPTQLSALGPRWRVLSQLDMLVLNRDEAAQLLVAPVTTQAEAFAAVAELTARGPATVVLTLGQQGVVTKQPGAAARWYFVEEVGAVDSTGAGDAFIAGLAAGLVTGRGFAEAIQCGARAASLAVQCIESACARVSPNVMSCPSPLTGRAEEHPVCEESSLTVPAATTIQ